MRENNHSGDGLSRVGAGLNAGCASREEKRRLIESVVRMPSGRRGGRMRQRKKGAGADGRVSEELFAVNASNCANARSRELLEGYMTLARQGVLLRGFLN